MTKDEALKLALEALGQLWLLGDEAAVIANPAITAIKQARALDKKAENARELGLDYEPVWCGHCNGSGRMVRDPDIGTDQKCFVCDGAGVPAAPVQEPYKSMSEHIAQATSGRVCIDPITGDVGIGTPAAQPAPVQEPVAWMDVDENGTMYSLRYWSEPDNRNEVALYRAPPNVATPLPAQQEPVAWCVLEPWLSGKFEAQDCFSDVALDANVGWVPLYTTPPEVQRQWVGLTLEEILETYRGPDGSDYVEYARAIEAKLREKNA